MSNESGRAGGDDDDHVSPEDGGEDDAFTFEQELDEAFGDPRPIYAGGEYTQDTAELPRQLDDGDIADAHVPPFLRENQVCIADRTEFVVRDEWGDITRRFKPEEVTLCEDGRYRVFETIDDQRACRHEVTPIRPECEHLVRQLRPPSPTEQIAGSVKIGHMKRYCAARRSVAGAFLELTDRALLACSMRRPYDVATSRLLDYFDDKKEAQSRDREHVPMFNLASRAIFGKPAPKGDPR